MQPDKQNDYWQNNQTWPGVQPNEIISQPINNQTYPQQIFQTPTQSAPQSYVQNPQYANLNPIQPAAANPEQIQEMYSPIIPIEDSIVSADNTQAPIIENAPVQWNASEYIYREKNSLWFIIFAIVVVVLILIDFLLIKSYTFSALVVIMAVAIVVYSRRPPRMVNYSLSEDHGLYIEEKLYHFNEFRAFGLIQDDGLNSVMLIPLKRFLPGVSVYFPQEVGEQVIDIFGARLPMESVKLDVIDIIVRKLRL